MQITRRSFVATAACASAGLAAASMRAFAQAHSTFQLSVLTDEISFDFDHACSVAANDFGMQWVELRAPWEKNIADFTADDTAKALTVLKKYNLRVTDIASPLFKVDWPGAPLSKFSAQKGAKNDNFAATADFKKQDDVLTACIELAKQFKTDKIRCFDFWRLDDVAPHRAAIDDKLREAAETTKKHGLVLMIENEHECNTVTAEETARVMTAVPALMLNWDPANAAMHGETDVFPAGWALIPKERIRHCHAKNVVRDAAGKLQWAPVDQGFIDWVAQFRALKATGFRESVSLETHWRGAGTPEASSRISWAGMKKCLKDAGTL